MQLTPLQLQIQERADKTLSFGCIIYDGEGYCFFAGDRRDVMQSYMFDGLFIKGISTSYKSIGHPMNRGRLCYLYETQKIVSGYDFSGWINLRCYLDDSRTHYLYQQTVLERPVELQELVLAFLKTLGRT